MMFNLGYAGLAEFENMKACVDAGDYDCAADEMEDSAWCGQVGRRCDKLTSMMRSQSAEHGYTEADIITCSDCINCINCINCIDCIDCINCSDCINCGDLTCSDC